MNHVGIDGVGNARQTRDFSYLRLSRVLGSYPTRHEQGKIPYDAMDALARKRRKKQMHLILTITHGLRHRV